MNIISKLNTDIVSINKEDEPLIYISEEAIYLKRNNDKLKQEIERLNNIIDNAIELTENILSTEDRGYYQLIFKEQLKVLKGEDKEILDKENK